MPLIPTLVLLIVSAMLALGAWWQDRKPYKAGNPPLVSPTMVFYIAVIACILLLAHLIGLLMHNQFPARSMY